LQLSPYIAGEHFSAADVYVGSHLSWGILFNSIEAQPVFEDYVARLTLRPAFIRANQINNQYMQTQKV
jgi:glutathione S-transferase